MTGHTPTPTQIIGELLAGHPEAASLQGEASHRQAVAVCSAALAGRLFTEAQAARLGYDGLRHRLDARRRHSVHFGVGLLLLAVLGAGLTMLDAIELGGTRSILLALAATAVWLTVAWLAALADRERRWAPVGAIIGGAVFLGLLLVFLHGLDHRGHGVRFSAPSLASSPWCWSPGPPCSSRIWNRLPCSWPGGAGIGRGPPTRRRSKRSGTMLRRLRWLRKPGWGWVRMRASAYTGDDGQLVHETVALAADLLVSGRPQLLPS